ncbi:2-deoxystreptamine N-acetyl-D-glucosaminyltransferase [Thiorhodovibrio winogradskyi]|uniref:2-deoxystreptamine N-acetyl-D-glucosaminyltransferase n=1 Tax=Thiorhodovibrio winogradskyi TaxID=77007 RepID=A0ABZ0SGG9_9GAMM|nr:glycosyltransferase [Thiorhodovibrio winogradskyi]
MRILNIIQCTNLGGMEKSNLLRLIGLKARGHSVQLISLNPLGQLAPLVKEADIPAIGLEYRGRFGWRSWLAMRRVFRDYEADVILMTGHNLVAALALLGHPAKKRVLAIHFHHFEIGKRAWHWPLIYAVSGRVFNYFSFASDYIRQEAILIKPSLACKSFTLPNPFIIPPYPTHDERRLARRDIDVDDEAIVIGNAGWLIARKRFDIFLQVASAIATTNQNAIFLIAGDGPERDRLIQQADQLGIKNKVRFLGWQRDLAVFYKSLDLLLFNTDFDALGRTPVEAAAYGVPVVASVIKGGLKEVFNSEEMAVVLDRHDIDRLAAVILDLITHPEQRELKGRALYQRVREYGDVEAHAHAMERLLTGQPL